MSTGQALHAHMDALTAELQRMRLVVTCRLELVQQLRPAACAIMMLRCACQHLQCDYTNLSS